MSTYIEIVAASSDTTTFGKDGLYANNREDVVRVEVENAADTNKIIIGPVVVSWNGRLISTQVFVLPSVAQPPTLYWDDLPREFRIPIRVVVSGRADSLSAADTLYIVRPFANAREFIRQDLTTPNTFIIGEILDNNSTPKSVRSRRGALVVGDVSLEGNGTGGATNRYNVSTLDCDPRTDGNQGYLPFVMLSTGKIDGGRAILSANASGKHGGAGGGGGGGQVCDAPGGNATTMRGGNGFTGGASGGNNASSPFLQNNWYDGGSGTGPKIPTNLSVDPAVFQSIGGSSLNGVGGATSRSLRNEGPQATGGGTGHPFGLSGRAWNFVTNDQTPAETAGGGIGRDNGISGDGGGYGTTGYSAASSGFAGGQRHGNEAVVPIAGGSGGASGNPRTYLTCSGDGGGGGGAIRIAGNQVTNLILEARGATGLPGTGGAPAGGSGSGGHISIHSREDVDNIFLNVYGGDSLRSRYLGAGRVRYDTPNRITQIRPIESRGITSSPADSLYRSYTGITLSKQIQTVASPYARPDTNLVNISGYGGAQGGIFLFRRSLRGRWERTDSTNLGDGQGKNSKVNFFTLFTPRIAQPLVEQDSLLFVVSVQRSFFPEPIAKEVIPEWVMSQSGTTIFTVEALPLIEVTPQSLSFQQVERCGVAEVQSTQAYLTIKNARAGFLRIDSVRVLSTHFTIDTVLSRPSFIPPNSPLRVPIRFTATSALPADSLFARTTVQIYHNDTIPDIGIGGTLIYRPRPLTITLQAPIKTIQFIIQPSIPTVNGDARIDFGNVAVGGGRDTLITIPNASRDAVNFVVSAAKQPLRSTPFQFQERSLISDSLQLRIRFQPDMAGVATTQTVIVRVSGLGSCSRDTISYRFVLSGVGTRPQLDTVNTSTTLSFGTIAPLCYPDSARASATFKVASGGNDILTAQIRMASTASLFVLSRTALSLKPNSEDSIRVQFIAPATTQLSTTYRDTLILTTNDPRPEAKERRIPIAITVQSNVARVSLVPLPPDTLRFGAVRFFNAVSQSVRITNSGNSPLTVNIGNLSAPYRLVRPMQSVLQLAPGAVDSIIVEVLPTDAQPADVPLRDFLRLSYTNVAAPCSLKPDSVALLATPTGPIAMQARVWLDTLRDVNMLRDTSIRLWGQVIGTAINRADTLRAAFKIRRGMFYPRAEMLVSPFGEVRLDTNRADSLDRFVVMTVPNVRLTASTTLIATIGGTPIATDTMRSVFEWVPTQTRWSRRDSVYDVLGYGNGLMVTTVVLQQIGNVLVPRLPNNAVQRRTTAIVSIYPTPAHDELTIAAQMPEDGVHTVSIVNMLGERLLTQEWKPETQNNAQNDDQNVPPSILTLPLASISSGVYGVIVVTPSGKRVSAMITIAK
jgi:hypothetical protein